ncbi:MAG: AmmeMemoRadiSam system radical SAM enzyme [Sphaerochaeta sp.]
MKKTDTITCDFCYRHCHLSDGQVGVCAVRERSGDVLFTHNYGSLVAIAVDPVEKKPLYHYLPGTNTFSIAMFGCNLRCTFCQNYTISQKEWEGSAKHTYMTAQQVVQQAQDHHCPSISFTYSEPLVWQDYMLEVAHRAKSEGLKTIMVSNGTFSEEALNRAMGVIDAFNIDIKGDEQFYRHYCGGSGVPVWQAIRQIAASNAHLEITTMVMEGVHTLAMIKEIGEKLSGMGVKVWHLSRYFPHYKEHRRATSEHFLEMAITTARTCKIPFIYPGNSSLEQNTYCPHCGELLISRSLIQINNSIKEGRCPSCGFPIYGCHQYMVATQASPL